MTTDTRKALWAIFLIVAVDVLGLTLIFPLLPFYAEKFGASPLQVGLLSATYAFFQLIAGPILGSLSDRFGRKPLLVLSQIGTLAGFLMLGFAETLWLIFLSRVIDGATAGNISLAQAYISDVTEPRNRAQAFGVIGIAFGLGFMVGPGVSGFLSQYDYRYPAFAAAALSALSVVCTLLLLKEAPRQKESSETRYAAFRIRTYSEYFSRPELGRLLGQFLLFGFAFATNISGFALFCERRFTTSEGQPYGPTEVGYLYAFTGLIGVVIQGGLLGKLASLWGEKKLSQLGFTAIGVAFLLLGFSRSLPELVVAITLSSFGSSVLRPSMTSLISQAAAPKEQGIVLGIAQSLISISQTLAPIAGGFLIEKGYLTGWAIQAGGLALLGLALSLTPESRIRR